MIEAKGSYKALQQFTQEMLKLALVIVNVEMESNGQLDVLKS